MRAVLLLVLVAGCRDSAPRSTAPAKAADPWAPATTKRGGATSLQEAVVQQSFVVVIPKGQKVDSVKAAAQARMEKVGGVVTDAPLPPLETSDRELIHYINPAITDADLDALGQGTAIAMGVRGEPLPSLRALAPSVLDIATTVNGWVIDMSAGATYTAAQFAKHVPGDPIDVRTQIYVHDVGGGGDLPFLDTMGMHKLGLPELMVAVASGGQAERMMTLINATAQTLVAHPETAIPGTIDVDLASLPGNWHVDVIRKNGGTGRVRWTARWVAAKDHPSDEKEIELVPATGSGTEGAGRLIDECFGTERDTVIGAPDDDPELAAAGVRARKELLAMKAHFTKGVPFKELLLVNAPFTEDGQTE